MTVKETMWNNLHFQIPENIYISHHLQEVGHIVLTALHAFSCILRAMFLISQFPILYFLLTHATICYYSRLQK